MAITLYPVYVYGFQVFNSERNVSMMELEETLEADFGCDDFFLEMYAGQIVNGHIDGCIYGVESQIGTVVSRDTRSLVKSRADYYKSKYGGEYMIGYFMTIQGDFECL